MLPFYINTITKKEKEKTVTKREGKKEKEKKKRNYFNENVASFYIVNKQVVLIVKINTSVTH